MTNNKHAAIIWISVVKPASADTGGKVKKIKTNMAPAINSTNGYCHEILLLHLRHEPFCAMKLKIGTNSFQVKVLPQDMHIDRPPSPLPVLNRSATTLRKLPTMAPKMNERTSESGSMSKMLTIINRNDYWRLFGTNTIVRRKIAGNSSSINRLPITRSA